ncbi:MAG: dTDP-4-dehydrorhamnose reductase [Planctomycetia bacterium]|nr:dTDP-4-dehydrorhamnose reductase [Planctomycetia bacterium]
MRNRILLLGAGGQLGCELARSLPALGEVVPTARKPAAATAPDEYVRLNIADTDALRRTVREIRPTVIVNAAAYTAVDAAEADPATAAAVNALAPAVLAEESRRLDAALVHYSTDYVFDGAGYRPWREDDRTGPLNEYGRTKLAGEEAIRAAGVAHLILRTSWLYSPRGHNFVRTMLRLGAERPELRVVADQVGAPTSARLVARVTAEILARATGSIADFLRERGGTLHACCAGTTSWRGLAEETFRLARAAGSPLRVGRVVPLASSEYPTAARRPLNSRLDCSRLANRFGVRLPDWRTELADCFPEIIATAEAAWTNPAPSRVPLASPVRAQQ